MTIIIKEQAPRRRRRRRHHHASRSSYRIVFPSSQLPVTRAGAQANLGVSDRPLTLSSCLFPSQFETGPTSHDAFSSRDKRPVSTSPIGLSFLTFLGWFFLILSSSSANNNGAVVACASGGFGSIPFAALRRLHDRLESVWPPP